MQVFIDKVIGKNTFCDLEFGKTLQHSFIQRFSRGEVGDQGRNTSFWLFDTSEVTFQTTCIGGKLVSILVKMSHQDHKLFFEGCASSLDSMPISKLIEWLDCKKLLYELDCPMDECLMDELRCISFEYGLNFKFYYDVVPDKPAVFSITSLDYTEESISQLLTENHY